MGFWLVCSLHLFLLYSSLLLKIFYSGLFVRLPMLWKMEGLSIFMVVAEGRVVGVEEDNSPVSALFLVRLLSLVFFSIHHPVCFYCFL